MLMTYPKDFMKMMIKYVENVGLKQIISAVLSIQGLNIIYQYLNV